MPFIYDKTLVIDILEKMINAVEKIESRCSNVNCVDDFLDDEDILWVSHMLGHTNIIMTLERYAKYTKRENKKRA